MKIMLMFLLIGMLFFENAVFAQARTGDGTVAIRRSSPSNKLMITVLPVAGPAELAQERITLYETLNRSLSASSMFDVVPYQLTVETVWEYFPGFLAVNPRDIADDIRNVELIGQLGVVEKERLAVVLGCDYILDGIVHSKEDGSAMVVVDLYRKSSRAVIASFKSEVPADRSYYEISVRIAQKIEGYFFDLFSDDHVLGIINRVTGHIVSLDESMEIFEQLIEKYPDNLFVWIGIMIVSYRQDNKDMVITAGERWFGEKDKFSDKQIRFFGACNENPYYILGKTYMNKYNYKRAQQVLYTGYKTFPFNTQELKKDLVICLRLLGEHRKADLIETQKE
ncbi:MAG: hypothetical protein RBU23_09205 [Candidatus Auribacterota bacterium]|jgi:tetratricopeptide (TPR) repeat protein|nr:hypothetical protein [Candidatus Auribacterota bacterium]